MSKFKKVTEAEILARFFPGEELLRPLIIREYRPPVTQMTVGRSAHPDASFSAGLPADPMSFNFVVEAKSQSTPLVISNAIAQAKGYAAVSGEQPMIIVPYLSPERLADLERECVSGIDLCGNGVVIVPGRLYVLRTGGPNSYRDSRPLNNPYGGRSAMVARMLLVHPRWESLSALRSAVQAAGLELSLSQTSKAVQALQDDLIISKTDGSITLQEPLRLLDKLANAWNKDFVRGRQALRLPEGTDWIQRLSQEPLLKWAITGESSVTRYATFSQGGPKRIAVSHLAMAQSRLRGIVEPVLSFADVELIETDEAGFYFDNEIDPNGQRWASRVQTWLELQGGDGRQQETAREIREWILTTVRS